MPKTVTYTLVWSPELQRYTLFDKHTLLDIIPDSPAWFTWLDHIASFSFVIEQERYTLRKEKRQRGAVYWSAYRSVDGQLSKKYLGRSSDLTLAHLEKTLLAREATGSPPVRDTRAPYSHSLSEERSETGFPKTTALPLLAPKLHIPRLPMKLISRERLLHLLEQQTPGPLTLISAQAGAGKTTLAAEWAARQDNTVAWVSLSSDENQPTRFFSYVITALQKLDPLIGTTSLPALHSLQPPPQEGILTLLVNEIAGSCVQPLTLVLDDYHVISKETIHQGITFLLDQLDSHLHLILLTRSDPPLPLPRLRARGQLVELRLNNLRFDNEEAKQFLQAVTDQILSMEDVLLLRERTEGWIAGLQLAALSLRGKADTSAFVREFAGSNRFVLDYLSEEILSHLPTSTLHFLLHTCVLERLSAPLCAAMLSGETPMTEQEAQQMLESLERANLFVSALDDEQQYFRYHALFASVLQAYLSRTNPMLIPLLHERACTWFEQEGLIHKAIGHALLLQDAERVCSLLQGIVWDMCLRGEFDVLLGWLDRLPDELERTQPALCLYHAMALACLGQADKAETYLKQGEQAEGEAQGKVISVGESAAVRVMFAVARGDLKMAREAAQQARASLPQNRVFLRSTVMGIEAIMAAIDGDFRLSLQRLGEAGQFFGSIQNPFILQRGLFGMALALTHLGQRTQVLTLCEQGMQGVIKSRGALLPYSGNLALFHSLALYEHYDLEAARASAQRGIELCERLREPALLPFGYALLAQILFMEQRQTCRSALPSQKVLRLMQQASSLIWQQPPLLLWSRQHAAYLLVRLWIAQDNQEALAHLEDFYPVDGETGAAEGSSYAAQTETWGLSYIRFGQNRPKEMIRWLDWPIRAAEQAGRVLALMRMLILQALAYQKLEQQEAARRTISRALQYAEPEEYIAMFLEMGELILPLLEDVEASSEVAQPFVRTLLRKLGAGTEEAQLSPTGDVGEMRGITQEPLTEREWEILRLVGAGLSNQAIAHQMVIEVSTVKWHLRHIYAKLQARNRTQALLQAQARGLLS